MTPVKIERGQADIRAEIHDAASGPARREAYRCRRRPRLGASNPHRLSEAVRTNRPLESYTSGFQIRFCGRSRMRQIVRVHRRQS